MSTHLDDARRNAHEAAALLAPLEGSLPASDDQRVARATAHALAAFALVALVQLEAQAAPEPTPEPAPDPA